MRFYFAVLALILAVSTDVIGQTKRPSLFIENTSRDVGTVTQGETIKQVFQFTNKGDATLEILDVQHSWGCEATWLSAKKIQPGKNGQIEARINTATFSGAIEKQITLTTNDPHNAGVLLTIKAVVEPEIAVSESSVFFENVPAGKEARKWIILTIPDAKPIKILSASSTDENVSAVLEPVSGSNGKKWKLILIRKPKAKPGYHFGRIDVKTTSKLTPELSIYERGTVPTPWFEIRDSKLSL
jgi:hypothetical protein